MMKRQEIRAYIILCLRAHSSASRFKKTLFFLFQSAAKKADLCAANQSSTFFSPLMRKKRADPPSKY